MLETIDREIEVKADPLVPDAFTEHDFKRGLEALQRLAALRQGLPEVDAVGIIGEMRAAVGNGSERAGQAS